MNQSWHGPHLDAATIDAYGMHLVDVGAQASIEQHLMECAECRAALAAACADDCLPGVGSDRLDAIWCCVLDVIDPPMPAQWPGRCRSHPKGSRLLRLVTRRARDARVTPWVRNRVVAAAAVAVVVVLAPSTGSLVAAPIGITPAPAGVTDIEPSPPVGGQSSSSGRTLPIGCAAGALVDGCAQGSTSGNPSLPCSQQDVELNFNWRQGSSGLSGKLIVTNTSDAPCRLPAMPDMAPLDVNGAPLTTGSGMDSGVPPVGQVTTLPPERTAASVVVWHGWCGAAAGATMRVGLIDSPIDVPLAGPLSPSCPPAGESDLPTTGELQLTGTTRRGNQPV